ncbi:MAG: RtcB family protein [Pirellula sp.]|nr:RtcB family protein [Pirellula sp.]
MIRKGSVHVAPGDLSILRSRMSGDVVLVLAKDRVAEISNSLSHGAGRKMSRSDCKPLADTFDFAAMRQRIMIPTGLRIVRCEQTGHSPIETLMDVSH